MQAACSYNPGPVRLECRPRAARMQACNENAENLLAPGVSSHCQRALKRSSQSHRQGSSQCQPQGMILPGAPSQSHRGTLMQQPSPVRRKNPTLVPRGISQCQGQDKIVPWSYEAILAPKASSSLQRRGKIIPWRRKPAANDRVRSQFGVLRQQPIPAPRSDYKFALAPWGRGNFQRQGKISPCHREPAAKAISKIRSYLGASGQQSISAPM